MTHRCWPVAQAMSWSSSARCAGSRCPGAAVSRLSTPGFQSPHQRSGTRTELAAWAALSAASDGWAVPHCPQLYPRNTIGRPDGSTTSGPETDNRAGDPGPVEPGGADPKAADPAVVVAVEPSAAPGP